MGSLLGVGMTSSVAIDRLDLTKHVGTELSGFQLLDLSDDAIAELLHILAERGVVVVRNQPMTLRE